MFPLGTTYWDQMAAMIAYLGQKVGGLDKLKGKKIAFLYHDSAYGKEPIPVLDALGAKLGYDVMKIPVTPPGQTMESQFLQIRQAKPDFVIEENMVLNFDMPFSEWGWGSMHIEDTMLINKSGFEPLTSLRTELRTLS